MNNNYYPNNPYLKEMLLANLVACCFFIPFNFYFTHMGNWIIYDVGFSTDDMGLIQGIPLILAILVKFSIVLSPIPLLGLLITLSRLTSSISLLISLR